MVSSLYIHSIFYCIQGTSMERLLEWIFIPVIINKSLIKVLRLHNRFSIFFDSLCSSKNTCVNLCMNDLKIKGSLIRDLVLYYHDNKLDSDVFELIMHLCTLLLFCSLHDD